MNGLSIVLALIAVVVGSYLMTLLSNWRNNVKTVPSIIPFLRNGISFVSNPRQYCVDSMIYYGDSFWLTLFGVKMFCVFGPVGVTSLYTVREKDASFTEATKGLLGLKIPDELLQDNNLNKFHHGLKARLIPSYLKTAYDATENYLQNNISDGSFELFTTIKQMVHAIALQCYIGGTLSQQRTQRLIDLYEQLDPESGFQNLKSLAWTILSGKKHEKQVFENWIMELKDIWNERGGDAQMTQPLDDDDVENSCTDNLCQLHMLHNGELEDKDHETALSTEARYRAVAADVFHFHLASQANLYAATSWTIYNLLTNSNWMTKVKNELEIEKQKFGSLEEGLKSPEFYLESLEQVMLESLRMTQQSITLRKVMKKEGITLKVDGQEQVHIPHGKYLMTLLSVTNMDQRAESDTSMPLNEFHPERYAIKKFGRLNLDCPSGTESLISTYGHGPHSCPGRTLATKLAIVIVIKLLDHFSLNLETKGALPPSTSVGAVARADRDVIIHASKIN